MDANYKVGQILYIIPADNATLVPVQVMERRISETVDGTAVKHIVKTPKAKASPLVLETVKGMIFPDLQQARNVMIRNATNAIDAMVRHANGVAAQVFAPKQLQKPKQIDDESNPFDTSGIVIDDSHVQQNEERGLQAVDQPQTTEYDNQPVIDDSEVSEVMLPDGRMQRVKLKLSR